MRRDRADVDDGAAAGGLEVPGGGPGHLPERLHVEVEHVVPLAVGHLQRRPVVADARVVDHDVETAEGVHRVLHDGVGRGGDVAGQGHRRQPLVGQPLLRLGVGRRVARGEGHRGAGLGQPLGEGVPDPAVAAGHQGLLAGQGERVEYSCHDRSIGCQPCGGGVRTTCGCPPCGVSSRSRWTAVPETHPGGGARPGRADRPDPVPGAPGPVRHHRRPAARDGVRGPGRPVREPPAGQGQHPAGHRLHQRSGAVRLVAADRPRGSGRVPGHPDQGAPGGGARPCSPRSRTRRRSGGPGTTCWTTPAA